MSHHDTKYVMEVVPGNHCYTIDHNEQKCKCGPGCKCADNGGKCQCGPGCQCGTKKEVEEKKAGGTCGCKH